MEVLKKFLIFLQSQQCPHRRPVLIYYYYMSKGAQYVHAQTHQHGQQAFRR